MKLQRRNFLKKVTSAGIGAISILPGQEWTLEKNPAIEVDFASNKSNPTGIEGNSNPGFYNSRVLFEAGTQDYYTYRIASMVATGKGTLLAFCAARKGKGGDWDPIDIVLRRSQDGRKKWEPLKVMVHRDGMPCDNAMPIVDYMTRDVHFLYQVDYAKCYYMKSKDDGLNWSDPVDITSTIEEFRKIYPWVVQAPGPGHGIQLKSGRLVVPFWLSDGGGKEFRPNHRGHRPSIVVSVYSDDHGKTWKAGEVAVPDNDVTVIPNETSGGPKYFGNRFTLHACFSKREQIKPRVLCANSCSVCPSSTIGMVCYARVAGKVCLQNHLGTRNVCDCCGKHLILSPFLQSVTAPFMHRWSIR